MKDGGLWGYPLGFLQSRITDVSSDGHDVYSQVRVEDEDTIIDQVFWWTSSIEQEVVE